MKNNWIKWPLFEGFGKTATKILQKLIGAASTSPAQAILATMVIGFVQVVSGLVASKLFRKKLFDPRGDIFGAFFYGSIFGVATILTFVIFLLGGEVGVNTFIITLAIVPGLLIDWLYFDRKIASRQWLGIVVAIVAGYAILDFPKINDLAILPSWVWLSFIVMLLLAINQGITQKLKNINPVVLNFWGGLAMTILSFAALLIFGPVNFLEILEGFWLLSTLTAFVFVLIWIVNLMSYKAGANIAAKNLLVSGTYLTSTVFLGIILFGEIITFGKIVGIILYPVAFGLIDSATWKYIKLKFNNLPNL